jgi:hypothetical protein
MRASLLRSVLIACLLGAAIYALTAGGASGQEYEQPPVPPPPPAPVPPEEEVLLLIRPFPLVRIRGVATPTGARIDSLTVKGKVGLFIDSRCYGGRAKGCPYKERVRQIKGTPGRTRRVSVSGFSRNFRSGVKLRLFLIEPGRIGKFTSFEIRRRKKPRRRDRCVRSIELTPIRCPD